MQVFLNDDRVTTIDFNEQSISDALNLLQQECCPAGRVIVSIRCDGVPVAPQELAAKLKQPVSDFDRLEAYTGTISELVTDALDQAGSVLEESNKNRQRISELVNQGRTEEGIALLGECLQSWQGVHSAIGQSIALLGIDPDATFIDDKPLSTAFDRPRDLLVQVKEAVVAHDYVMLADILEYEFQEVTELWRAALDRLAVLARQSDEGS